MRSLELGRRDLTFPQKAEIEKLEASFTQQDVTPPDALTVSDLEDQIDSLLRSHGQNDLWQLAAALARRNIRPEVLESLFAILDGDTARAALIRIAASEEVASLLHEIESSTSRISDLVGAIKEYTYMDQAAVHNVDVVKSLETTLTILNYKLKKGVAVQRDYPAGSSPRQFFRERVKSGMDQHHRQCNRRHGRKRRTSRANLPRGYLRCG